MGRRQSNHLPTPGFATENKNIHQLPRLGVLFRATKQTASQGSELRDFPLQLGPE
jgi:hypothetical protein